jgi:hypothetical protein
VTAKKSLRSLALSMIVLLLLYPFLTAGTPRRVVMNVLMSAIFFFGITAVSDSKKHLAFAVSLAVPWFLLTWATMVAPDPGLLLNAAANVLSIAFFTFTVAVILAYILRSERVTDDVLWGAVAVYLLLGGLWFTVFTLIEALSPGSFLDTTAGAGQATESTELLYFSFTTLTTLGYGDIVPATLVARHFAVTEAIVGVMYLAVVISRLVGLFIAEARGAR